MLLKRNAHHQNSSHTCTVCTKVKKQRQQHHRFCFEDVVSSRFLKGACSTSCFASGYTNMLGRSRYAVLGTFQALYRVCCSAMASDEPPQHLFAARKVCWAGLMRAGLATSASAFRRRMLRTYRGPFFRLYLPGVMAKASSQFPPLLLSFYHSAKDLSPSTFWQRKEGVHVFWQDLFFAHRLRLRHPLDLVKRLKANPIGF
jgi:hypothetical protein